MATRRRTFFHNRSVVEIMVLTITFLVVGVIIVMTLGVVIAEILDPATDTSPTVDALIRIVTSAMAALLGLLAGQNQQLDNRPDGTDDEVQRPGEP